MSLPVFVKSFIHSDPHNGPSIIDLFPEILVIDSLDSYLLFEEARKDCFTYIEIPYFKHNVILKGYYQSPRYFENYCCPEPFTSLQQIDAIFLHVRRGDFLVCKHHAVDLTHFRRQSLMMIPKNCDICVCSDDIEWCKLWLPKLYGDIVLAHRWKFIDASPIETIAIMSACSYGGICSNSTFSWWAGYWNMRRWSAKIYMPAIWGFKPMPPTIDLFPDWATVF
jgi:hypothetical protein